MKLHGSLSASAADTPYTTLTAMMRAQAARYAERTAFTFLQDGESDEAHLTYAGLDRRARAIAAYLQHDLPPSAASPNGGARGADGRVALLLFPPGLAFISAFFGCLYAGVLAVPAYPPRRNRPSPRIQAIAADCGASVVLTTDSILSSLQRRFDHVPDLAALTWLSTVEIADERGDAWRQPDLRGDNLAFLQYTSGSTGTPKGVMISHANLLHNLEAIRSGFLLSEADLGVSWLPSFHDMGLIGGLLETLYSGVSSYLMAPAAFLQRPVRWLETISRQGATVSGGPNFAYQMCVDKIPQQQCEGLDLSSWRVAYCGAEPIRPATLRAFAARFGAYGFGNSSFYPCYGLAENTLIVSGDNGPAVPHVLAFEAPALAEGRAIVAGPDSEAQPLASSGPARRGQQVVIADPDTRRACAPDEIGEIWVSGASVAQGYWRQPEVSGETFGARLAENERAGPFLRTGDMGFLHDGHLFVSGRLKDLIIIRGRNSYPQDIEHTVGESHEALETGMCAAFSVDVAGEERLVVVQEMARAQRSTPIEAILPAVRAAVAREHGLQLYALVLIRPLAMPRTSSGKIQRR
ncbi:MAG: fatty acyl-AMP ligase, partial [Candidatus Promineifilaceae bacterium]